MKTIKSQLLSIFGAAPAAPGDLKTLRATIKTAEDHAEGALILKEHKLVRQMGADLTLPLKRRAVVEYVYRKPLEEIDGVNARTAQAACLEHDPIAIADINNRLIGIDREIEERAVALLRKIHARYVPVLEDEIGRARELLHEIFDFYGAAHAVEDSAPMVNLRNEMREHRDWSGILGANGPGHALGRFGITLE